MTQFHTPDFDRPSSTLERVETCPSIYALVIPAYNEAATIKEVVQKALCYINEIILVDDVLTTGATVNECARTLKKAGAGYVEVWALARTLSLH